MSHPYFDIESPSIFPDIVRAGVVLRSGVSTVPTGPSFWSAATTPPREVVLNRKILAAGLAVDPSTFCFMHQVHGTTIVERFDARDVPTADGQWSSRRGLYLAANIADCCPVVVYSPNPPRVALLHSGWRGTAHGIVDRLFELWASESVDTNSVRAWIGPCADADRYEVGPEVRERFDRYPEALRPAPGRDDHAMLDIPAVIGAQLRAAGVPASAIEVSEGGTIGDRRYHSFRRDRFSSGRMLAFAALR